MQRAEFAACFKSFIKRFDRFMITGHIRPDGDSIGACVGLYFLLESLGKEAYVCLDGNIDNFTPLLAPFKRLESPEEAAAVKDFALILADVSDPGRTGWTASQLMRTKSTLSLDHHLQQTEYTDFHYCEPEMSSAAELMYHMIREMDYPVTKEMAQALYIGICADSGAFRHPTTTTLTLRTAADLMELGADGCSINNMLFHHVSFKKMRARAYCIEKSKLYEGGILICALTQADIYKLDCDTDELSDVVNELNDVSDANIVVLMRELADGSIRANMRAKPGYNVQRVALCFGGGGHIPAAACTLFDTPMLLAKTQMLDAIHQSMEKE